MDKNLLTQTVLDLTAEFLTLPDHPINRLVEVPDHSSYSEESIVITGIRRCGKSYLMKLMAIREKDQSAIMYLNLDDPRLNGFTADDFQNAYTLWLSQLESIPDRISIYLDEPQNIVGWEKWVNYFSKKKNHKIILTGSNANLLSSDLATHLTGRHKVIELYPFSFKELSSHFLTDNNPISESQLYTKYLKLGGFPRVYLSEDQSLLGQYFKDIILRDISTRKGALPAKANMELGLNLMTNATNLTNKTTLAKLLGFKQPRTIAKHIHAFTDSYLFKEIKLFSPSIAKQTRSQPKYYPADHALARKTRFTVMDDQGISLEIIVANELARRGYELFYWKSKENFEVDFIGRKLGSPLIAIQVCLDLSNDDTLEREIRALKAANAEIGIDNLLVVTHYQHTESEISFKNNKVSQDIEIKTFTQWAMEN